MFTILVYIFIGFAWSRALLRYRDRIISVWELLFWTALWGAAATVIAWPGLTGLIAERAGIGRGSDLTVYGSIMLIFYLLFRVYIKIDLLQREITRLVRALAIEQASHNNKEHK
ncbi:MAG: hypothetical protein K0S20_672 [Patescibacteria group bacterium]|jgi:hypothetical protein|nr:hypothetical protein [Patescibacteria group bacterium]